MTAQTPTGQLKTIWLWLLLMAGVLLLGGSWIIINRTGAEETPPSLEPAPIKGHPAPEISLLTTDGLQLNLSDFKGKPVVINFWATWCPPCRAETPELQAIHRELGDEVIIFSVNATSQDNGDIEAFRQEFGVTFPVLLDETGEASQAYNVLGLPTTIFVDRNGIINEVFSGAVNKAYIESKISEL